MSASFECWCLELEINSENQIGLCSVRSVFAAESRNLLEVTDVASYQNRLIRQGDARH